MTHPTWWVWFHVVVFTLLALDLGVLNRRAHAISPREALGWSAFWASLAAGFGVWVWQSLGRQAGLEFAAGYVVELALSVDNLFVFLVIFGWFRVPAEVQHRVLFWGILGALVMRGAMIGTGALLLARFHWLIYVFGAFLLITGIRMALASEHSVAPEQNPVIRILRRILPVTTQMHGTRFFVRESIRPGAPAQLVATPLFVVLLLVETTDVVFALDSIPAIFGVTRDPFIVYTSNVFAILGLRSLYFLLAGVMDRFHLLRYGLSLVLAFIGAKMLAAEWYHVPIGWSLGIVALLLGGSVIASLLVPPRPPASPPLP